MDYCYACRRHLNGAYSCPGCGTPADRLALPAVGETAQLPAIDGDDGLAGDAPSGGRAARRLAARGQATHRARRGRQRATVYGIGVIAAVGAAAMLSVAALSGGSSGDGTPASPLDHNPPAPTSGDTSPDGSGTGPAHAAPSGGPQTSSPTATATTSPTASGSASPTTTPGGGTPSTPASPVTGSISPNPPSRTPTTAPTTQPPTSSSPSPTQTPCKQVLWWCS